MIARVFDRSVPCLTRPFALLVLGAWLATSIVCAFGAEPPPDTLLRVAVYNVPPYGYTNPDGSISGISVDLWRRVAERLQRQFKLIPVADMESVLGGLEQDQFDAAIGAITITPEREKRVDFAIPPIGRVSRSLCAGIRGRFPRSTPTPRRPPNWVP
jgi:ABC-type amino acid transport substrate-binding protein